MWLNEGFARLYGKQGTGMVLPAWRQMETFVTNTLQAVFQADSLNPRAMSYYVESPQGIDNLFSTIAYEKGLLLL